MYKDLKKKKKKKEKKKKKKTRMATFKRSCIPASVDLWKNLDPTTGQKPTLSSFSYALRSQVILNIVSIYYRQ